jgi:peptidoglycan hydrolase-like protein with peptidoglycan-binding domain
MNAGPGTDTTIATLQPAPATTLAPPQFLDYGPHVREAQVHLAQLGFGPGPIDGLLGPRTATAIRAFQQAKGLEATGSLTTTVVSALRSDVAGRGIRPRSGAAAPATPVERGAEIQSDASHLANPVAQSCRGNQGKWIYVEEFKRYVYCGAFSEGIVR